MPSKYRKNIWIKRGDFLIVDPIEEGEKVKAEISFVLCKDHMRSLQKQGLWPEAFSEVVEKHSNMNSQPHGAAGQKTCHIQGHGEWLCSPHRPAGLFLFHGVPALHSPKQHLMSPRTATPATSSLEQSDMGCFDFPQPRSPWL
ncbi:putative RNA-binding protein EIF1AD isoform X3 [Callithrix jacchus]|nr:probable RNA-binding protein EIF1AD isoform X3 [Callithrix jacchus]